jgi:hypothetical protein
MNDIIAMFSHATICVLMNENERVLSVQDIDVVKEHGQVEILFNGSAIIDNDNIDKVSIVDDITLNLTLTEEYGIAGNYILKLYKNI